MDIVTGRNLVQRWRSGGAGARPATLGAAPVSAAQQGILAFEQLHPGTPVFNVCFAARHAGGLDEGRFDGALSTLIRRHPALRSTFTAGEAGPARTVHDTVPVAASWTDLRHLPRPERLAAARELIARIASKPFDLGRAPLVRVHGCRLTGGERLIVFLAHHLVCDGGSLRVLLAELDAAYRGELGGLMPDANPQPRTEAAVGYWREQLAGLPRLDLPADYGPPAHPAFLAGSVPLAMPEDLVTSAVRLARAENATAFMVILAAFQLLLGELSGQADFAVGAPEAGRAQPGQHGVVGLLASPLMLRTDLSGRPSFRGLVRRARVTCLAAFAHRGVPFEELVAASTPGRRLDGALVQASLVFHGELGEPALAGSPLQPLAVPRPGLPYAVDLHLWQDHGRLAGSWDYRTEMFEPVTAARMAERLPVLLARVLAEPDQPVDQLGCGPAQSRVAAPHGEPGQRAAPSGGPPRGPAEELVAEVWRQVLDLDSVGRDDDFFDLGGDSLLASQVLSKLTERVGSGVSLPVVFERSRLADLAAALPAPAGPGARGSAVPRRPPDAEPVLSFDQQRVWLECQVKPGAAYNVHGRLWLRGPLDLAALERSFRAIIGRHETLRTTFPLVQWRPEQRVADPDPGWRITVSDLSGRGPTAVSAAERLADEQAAMPFDLAAGPLFGCLLVRLSDTDHLLSMTIHHIVADGRSAGLMLRELAALYQAGGDADRAGLPALPVQYRDYAVWQRTTLTGEHLAEQVGYWRGRLAGAPPAIALPTARRRLPSQATTGGRVRATLSADDSAALYRMGREHDVTPFMTLLAALATVLRRWSGLDDLVIGVPVNTRRDAGTDALIGFFINTVPVRIDLAGDPAFSELLGRVRRTCLDGYLARADTPFDVLVSQLRVVRDPTRTPLFQVLLNMIESAEEGWRLPGISVEVPEQPVQPGKVDLGLDVRQAGGVIRFDLLYHADRYDAPAMRALLDQLCALLVAVAADPSRGILQYALQPAPDSGITPPSAASAPHRTLVRRARLRPDQAAVVDRDGSWTYRQLAGAVTQVADLVAAHAKAAGAVSVVRRASAGLAAAVLGCQRAAVPYAVLEPGKRAPAHLVLDPVPAQAARCGTTDVRALLRQVADWAPDEGPDLPAEPADWAAGRFGLTADDRFAVLSDDPRMLMSAMGTAMSVGGMLFVADDAMLTDPDALVEWLRSTSVTAMYLAPPLLRTLEIRGCQPAVPQLRYAFLPNAGDLTAHDVTRARQLAPGCRVITVYRLDETGQPFAAYEVPANCPPETTPLRIPLGSEVSGPAVLLNPAGQPAATGEVAELCLGTARTGDLVRRRPDHLLEFAGRSGADGRGGVPSADLLEAVAALRDLPDVLDAVVTKDVGPDGGTRLTAYVANPARAVQLGRLRQHLVTHVPEYLVPRQVVVLERLPLTPCDDYDLDALPRPAEESAAAGSPISVR